MTMTLISTISLTSGSGNTLSFDSIPQTFTDLMLVVSARTTGTTNANFAVRPNNNIGNVYTNRTLYGSGSSAASETISGAGVLLGDYAANYVPNASSTANTFSNIQIYFSNYTSSTAKSVAIEGTAENNSASTYIRQSITASLVNDTNPITSMIILIYNGNFAQYSTFSLYGITKGSGGATVS